MTYPFSLPLKATLVFVWSFLFLTINSHAYTVEKLKSHYSHGQIFLTWKNVPVTNLQYNIYRSSVQFTDPTQLNSDTYLGFVRDSSSKNYRLSLLDSVNIFYKWRKDGKPLKADKGLYAITCTKEDNYYYAVTVMDLSTDIESKEIIPGENSLLLPAKEKIEKPQPVLQDSIFMASGLWKYRYVQFCNNQETPLYPAMNSTGSYGFNFFLVKKGSSSNPSLRVSYKGDDLAANIDVAEGEQFTESWILGVDDWLPVLYDNGSMGEITFYCCYHENFNIYTEHNPKPTSGIVKLYTRNESLNR